MKVKTLNTDKETNEFLDRNGKDIEVVTITPINDGKYSVVYKEKLIVDKKVYRFGCGSHLGTTWSRQKFVFENDEEYKKAKQEFIEEQLSPETWRFREELVETVEFTTWK